MPLKIKVSGKSDVGLVRKGNEDSFHIDSENHVYAVCDGMGGHKAGEVASMMTADLLEIIYRQFLDPIHSDSHLKVNKALPVSGDVLLKSIRLSNRAIYNKAFDNSALHGMGTTVVAFAFENDLLSIAHVGDSRAYRIDKDSLFPLTTDHSWVAEIQKSQNLSEEEASSVVGKNVITRALGVRDTVEVDYSLIKIKSGQKFMLCSDGLCGYADDDEIFEIVRNHIDDNEKIVDNLIQMANDRGGADNVTVIVVEILETTNSNLPEVETFTLPGESEELLTRQDEWINKINDYISKKNSKPITGQSKPQKSTLLLLFALFIITAAIIIYFAVTK